MKLNYHSPKCGVSQHQPSNIRNRFPLCYEPKGLFDSPKRMANGELKITSVQSKVTAKISELHPTKNHGFIDYFVEEEVMMKTITKNGARTIPDNNGKIYFHTNEVSGPIEQLKVGETVEFNLVHVKTNNKVIAQRIAKLTDQELKSNAAAEEEKAKQLAHFQRFELPKTFKTPEQPKIIYVKEKVIGELCEIEIRANGTGHAFLKSKQTENESPSKILLHFNQITGTDTSVMKIGDTFRFKLFKNNHNGRYIARNAQYLQPGQVISDSKNSCQSVETLGHFQFMEAPKLSKSTDLPKFTPILRNATGTIQSTILSQHCGFIKLDTNFAQQVPKCVTDIHKIEKVFFHENDLVGKILSELNCSNDRVMFTLERNNHSGKFVAKTVEMTSLAETANGIPQQSVSVASTSKGMSAALSGLSLAKSTWTASAFELPSGITGENKSKPKNNNLKPYNVSLLNESEKRRRSVETLNKISNSKSHR